MATPQEERAALQRAMGNTAIDGTILNVLTNASSSSGVVSFDLTVDKAVYHTVRPSIDSDGRIQNSGGLNTEIPRHLSESERGNGIDGGIVRTNIGSFRPNTGFQLPSPRLGWRPPNEGDTLQTDRLGFPVTNTEKQTPTLSVAQRQMQAAAELLV